MTNSKPTIYLVDDHKSFTYLTKHVVNHYHNSLCDIYSFTSAKEALKTIIEAPNKLDYLFLDLSMPEIDGWSFLEALSKELNTKSFSFQVIIVTGSESVKDRDIAMSNNQVTHFINKPLDMDKIKQIFESDKFLRSYRKSKISK